MANEPHYKTLEEFTDDYVWDERDSNAKLGEGGFGKVWKAYHETQNEYVAIKVCDYTPHRPSLMDEVQTAKTLPKHPNIVYYNSCHRFNIKGSGAWDYAVMKYYEDGNLSQLLKRTQLPADDSKHLILSAEYRDKLIVGLLAGIAHLHKHNIVHRDLKPGNVLIAKHPKGWLVPKITDFGLSKVVSEEQFIKSTIFNNTILGGSPAYQAPEQLEESEMRFNVDLWAFGVILYEIMTGGENPFYYSTTGNSGYPSKSVLSNRITKVILPGRLSTIEEPYQTMIRRCLVKNIHKRVKSAGELFDIKDGIPSKMAALKKAIEEKSYRHALDLAEKLLKLRPQNEQVLEWKQQCEDAMSDEERTVAINKVMTFLMIIAKSKEASKISQVKAINVKKAELPTVVVTSKDPQKKGDQSSQKSELESLTLSDWVQLLKTHQGRRKAFQLRTLINVVLISLSYLFWGGLMIGVFIGVSKCSDVAKTSLNNSVKEIIWGRDSLQSVYPNGSTLESRTPLCHEALLNAQQNLTNGVNPNTVMNAMREVIKSCGAAYKDSTSQIFMDRAESFRGLSTTQFERFKSYADSLRTH